MNSSVRDCYEAGLRSAAGGADHGWWLRGRDGQIHPAPLQSWCAVGRPGDRALLDACAGPTLDVGCGPGRLTAALAGAGLPALGVDITPEAVRQTRARGAAALRRDVFHPLPAEGRWRRILLADGNIGIGGDPDRLLRRAGELLTPGGRLLCETDRPEAPLRRLQLRFERRGQHSDWFDWAVVGAEALAALAGTTLTWRTSRMWTEAGRWFVELVRG